MPDIPRRFALGVASCLLAGAVLGVFGQVGGFRFLEFDDDQYVYRNPSVLPGLTWKGFSWAFTSFHVSNWHPLTWLSHMGDVELFGMNAGAHHLVNAGFHVANTVLLLFLLYRMTGSTWRSMFVAALFAVHPLHVESVAWVAERKDVLSTFFGLWMLLSYAWYAERPGWGRYVPVALFFVLGLLSKAMLVTFPFVLLLLDWWPLGRFSGVLAGAPAGVHPFPAVSVRRLAMEKVPLLALALASGAVTFAAQTYGGAMSDVTVIPPGWRVANALSSYVRYLGKTLYPSSLGAFYPHRGAGIPVAEVAAAGFLLAGLTAMAVWQARRRPWLAVGWFWYVGTLVPVIGLVQVGGQAMADRYTYVPLIGIFLAVVWGVAEFASGRPGRRVLLAVAGVTVLAALAVAGRAQATHWRDDVTLFRHTLEVTTGNWVAHYNLGVALMRKGQDEEAIRHFQETVRIDPDYSRANHNLGLIHHRKGRLREAVGHYREAIRVSPGSAETRFNLGCALVLLGEDKEAMDQFREVLRLSPGHRDAESYLGALLLRSGR